MGASSLACRNCGTALPNDAHYCPQCGQDTAPHPPTLLEFVHEFFDHYIALEGSMWRTLWLLISKPGELTREYLEGRKRRYVLPLRLYLTLALVAMLTLGATKGLMHVDEHKRPDGTLILGSAPKASDQQAAEAIAAEIALRQSALCRGWFADVCERFQSKLIHGTQADLDKTVATLPSRFLKAMNYGMLAMMPVFAGLLSWFYRRRRMTYGEHMVFSLHAHAFAALVVIAAQLPFIGDWFLLAFPIHTTLALYRVYGGHRLATVARSLALAGIYSLLLAVLTLSVAMFAALY